MENVYTLKAETSRWQVEVSPSTDYGWFQDLKTGAEGGLWFDEKKELCDYDGSPVVPRAVGAILHAMGYTVEVICYAQEHALTDDELENGRRALKTPFAA
jgi:hypothetical protein